MFGKPKGNFSIDSVIRTPLIFNSFFGDLGGSWRLGGKSKNSKVEAVTGIAYAQRQN
jgi:hypothetical protein